jgi:hypothetical protein
LPPSEDQTTATVSRQCQIPCVLVAYEANGPVRLSGHAQATPRCSPEPGPMAVAGLHTAPPIAAPVTLALQRAPRCCLTPLTRLSCQRPSRVARRQLLVSQSQAPRQALDCPLPCLALDHQVVRTYRRWHQRLARLSLVRAHPDMAISRQACVLL